MTDLPAPVSRRRTFAIISHPDAGKTTLTEKLLLFGGAIQLAGEVKAKRNRVSTRSDWMGIEKERGISVVTSVMTFEYGGCVFNLLDTPGHRDFSEDTYRTLIAADGAVMVLDAARGIQQQTLKLFEVCRRQRLPIVTFINKLDQPGREPLELLDEIERALGLTTAPLSWPIGDGSDFQGVYDLRQRSLHRFERTERGQRRAPVVTGAAAVGAPAGRGAEVTGRGCSFSRAGTPRRPPAAAAGRRSRTSRALSASTAA